MKWSLILLFFIVVAILALLKSNDNFKGGRGSGGSRGGGYGGGGYGGGSYGGSRGPYEYVPGIRPFDIIDVVIILIFVFAVFDWFITSN